MEYIHESWCNKENDTQGIWGYIKLAIKIFLFDKDIKNKMYNTERKKCMYIPLRKSYYQSRES